MKRKILQLIFLAMATCLGTAKAQLNGTYTIGGTSPDYATLSAAVSALNSVGVSGPVQFLIRDGVYTATTWRAQINAVNGASATNRITFRSQSGNKANVNINLPGTSSTNYIVRLNNSNYITFKDLTFTNTNTSYGCILDFGTTSSYDSVVNCSFIGATSTSTSYTSMALIYAYSYTGSEVVFHNNLFQNGATWVTWYGSSTTSGSTNAKFINNTFSMTNSGYYGIFHYYGSGTKFLNNTFNYTGTSTFYNTYIYYPNNDFEFSNNVMNLTSSSTLYTMLCNYANYYSNSQTLTPKCYNNVINSNNSAGTTYTFYVQYWYYGHFKDNVINHTQTSGTGYLYGPLYMANNSKAENNTFNMSSPSSGSLYNMSTYQGGGQYIDTFVNNTVNFTSNGGTIYNYMGYYGSPVITDNTFNVSNTGGTTYNRIDYASGMLFARNKVKCTTTTGTMYGLYFYNTTSYQGGTVMNNDFDFSSTSGAIYGVYTAYLNNDKFYSNLVTTKTAGTSYLLYMNYSYNAFFKNNTFHSLSTGATDYLAYIYHGSTSYKAELKNNIFSRNSSNGYGFYTYDNNYTADYNLYYVPGGTLFYSGTPAYTGASMQAWRDALGGDKNSLVYQPPYVNAAVRDFRINASSPAAWAVNGRAEHDTVIKQDMTGANRPITVATGVPDLGAYEVSPTSTPPNADASPANPVANSTQVFTFGQDTVATIDWGADVPSTYTVRQYTGVQAAPMPPGVGRMYFYVAGTPSTWIHGHKPNIYYKDPWVGTIPGGENDAVPARSSNNGAWEGYNYTNAQIDKARNIVKPTNTLDSVGSYTAVQNGRIGIRCVENPKGIAITNITAFDADIDWQPVFNPIGYQVLIKKNSKYPTNTEWSSSNLTPTNNLAAGGLDEDTKYYVFIRSICGAKDTSGFSMDSFTTLITCHTPVITISGVNGNRAVISWTAIKTAHKYEYALSKSSTPPAVGTDINKNSMLAPFLDEGVEYYVHVRAHCSSMYDKSDWASAKFNTWAVGVNNVNGESKGLSVFPNPADKDIVITIAAVGSEAIVAITDITGKTLKTQNIKNGTTKIDISDLPAGMYIIQYADEHGSKQTKFNKL